MANPTIHILVVEDNPVDVRLLRKLVTEVSFVRFAWKNIERPPKDNTE
jgi:hypothetical protein